MRRLCTLLVVLGVTIVSLSGLTGMGGSARADTYTVGVRPLKIGGSSGVSGSPMETAVLTNSDGLSLYYNSADTQRRSTCTGACAKIWPPLINDAPTLDPKVKGGKVGVVHDANGAQVTFNGHLLYRYSKDTAPGTALGYGKAGKWYVATPSLASW